MARTLYIVDFDRTIFDTENFIEDLKQVLHKAHNISPDGFDATISTYIEPGTKYYNFHSHAGALTHLAPNHLDELIIKELGHQNYIFPDVKQWLADRNPTHETVIIMTVGRPPFQELKFRHAKAVDGIQKLVVPKNKGELIRNHFAGQPDDYPLTFLDQTYESIYLIDDSPETFHRLSQTSQITAIRLARPGAKYTDIPAPTGTRIITHFGELS